MTSASDPAPSPKPRPRHRLLFLVAAVALAGVGAALIMNARARQAPEVPAAPVSGAAADTTVAKDGIIAYYFHTTYRCTSCQKIEAYSKLAIETAFAPDLASGRLQWRMVNVEDEGNEHFVKDYRLFTKSLILSEQRAGREVRWRNLPRVWELLNDEPAFVDYVQTETRAFLAEAP